MSNFMGMSEIIEETKKNEAKTLSNAFDAFSGNVEHVRDVRDKANSILNKLKHPLAIPDKEGLDKNDYPVEDVSSLDSISLLFRYSEKLREELVEINKILTTIDEMIG